MAFNRRPFCEEGLEYFILIPNIYCLCMESELNTIFLSYVVKMMVKPVPADSETTLFQVSFYPAARVGADQQLFYSRSLQPRNIRANRIKKGQGFIGNIFPANSVEGIWLFSIRSTFSPADESRIELTSPARPPPMMTISFTLSSLKTSMMVK